MKAPDTNVLVRFLVCDDEPMTARAQALFEQARDAGEPLQIPNLALLGSLVVLGYSYGFSRDTILDVTTRLLTLPSVTFESYDMVNEFVRMGQASTLDLPDILIGLRARPVGADTTVTFDKKASRSELLEKIA